jgi:hypothetical protein
MPGVTFQVSVRARATAMIKNFGVDISPDRTIKPAAEGVQELCVSHLQVLAYSRHRSGSPRNFYADAARLTARNDALSLSAGHAVLTIAQQGIAQRFFGGTINAKPGKSLAISAHPAVAGKRAAEVFESMHLQFRPYHGPNSFGALVAIRDVATMIAPKRKSGVGRPATRGGASPFKATGSILGEVVMYWLCKSVDQMPDPSVLPTAAAMQAAAWTGARNYIQSIADQFGKN